MKKAVQGNTRMKYAVRGMRGWHFALLILILMPVVFVFLTFPAGNGYPSKLKITLLPRSQWGFYTECGKSPRRPVSIQNYGFVAVKRTYFIK